MSDNVKHHILTKLDKIKKENSETEEKEVKELMKDVEKSTKTNTDVKFKPVKKDLSNKQQEEVDIFNRGFGMEDLRYDSEPDELFKERMKKNMDDKGDFSDGVGLEMLRRAEKRKEYMKSGVNNRFKVSLADTKEEKNKVAKKFGLKESVDLQEFDLVTTPEGKSGVIVHESPDSEFVLVELFNENDETEGVLEYKKSDLKKRIEESDFPLSWFKMKNLSTSENKTKPNGKIDNTFDEKERTRLRKKLMSNRKKIRFSESEESEVSNPNYTHYGVDKLTNKIVTGWDYSDIDKDELNQFKKDYFSLDIKNMGLNPKDVKILTKGSLIKQGLNPQKLSDWLNFGESNEISDEDLESSAEKFDSLKKSVNEGRKKKTNPFAVCTSSVGREDKKKYERCVKKVKKQINEGEMGMRTVKVKFENGKEITTSINGTDEEIKNYYKVGREFNIGDGVEDDMQKVKSVQIKESSLYENHEDTSLGFEIDDEGNMIMNQLSTASDAIDRIMDKIKTGEEKFPAWIQAKVTKGSEELDVVADHLSGDEINKLEKENNMEKEINETVVETTIERVEKLKDLIGIDELLDNLVRKMDDQTLNSILGVIESDFEIDTEDTEYEEVEMEEGLDKVGQEDSDINNDGEIDSQDEYLKNRREKISDEMNEKKEYKLKTSVTLSESVVMDILPERFRKDGNRISITDGENTLKFVWENNKPTFIKEETETLYESVKKSDEYNLMKKLWSFDSRELHEKNRIDENSNIKDLIKKSKLND